MKSIYDMTPDEVAAHINYVNSGQAAQDFMDYHERLEKVLETVTEKVAMERELQEVVLDPRGTPRFRENVLVSKLLGPPHDREGVAEPWMWDQFRKLIDDEKGNTIVRWLLANGRADMNEIAEQGILEINGKGFPQKDHEQFAMLIGYSVGGAGELSYFSPTMIARADLEADRLLAGQVKV